jgi:DMSO/TMAO reductase YedYZ molybdopterin-dependent catalytic subunit
VRVDRRSFLGLAAGALIWPQTLRPGGSVSAEPVPFVGEGAAPLGAAFGEGLDGRLYTDVSTITRGNPIVPNDRYYVRTRVPSDLPVARSWAVRVLGPGGRAVRVTLDDLRRAAAPRGVHVMECAGNGAFARFGMLSAAEWTGVPVVSLLERAGISEPGSRVLASGHDAHATASSSSSAGASWIFTVEELARAEAFLATAMNGAALPADHGAPVRLLVPTWYGCSSIKWLSEIAVVDPGAPSTPQMKEFASRTDQDGVPERAADYKPAIMELAALPVQVEKLRGEGPARCRILGLAWGGGRLPETVLVESSRQAPARVPLISAPAAPWGFWSCEWTPPGVGRYNISVQIDDPGVRARRLAQGFYTRTVAVTSL